MEREDFLERGAELGFQDRRVCAVKLDHRVMTAPGDFLEKKDPRDTLDHRDLWVYPVDVVTLANRVQRARGVSKALRVRRDHRAEQETRVLRDLWDLQDRTESREKRVSLEPRVQLV